MIRIERLIFYLAMVIASSEVGKWGKWGRHWDVDILAGKDGIILMIQLQIMKFLHKKLVAKKSFFDNEVNFSILSHRHSVMVTPWIASTNGSQKQRQGKAPRAAPRTALVIAPQTVLTTAPQNEPLQLQHVVAPKTPFQIRCYVCI